MNRIQFINQEIITQRRKKGVLQILLLICAIFVTIGNLILILVGGLGEVTLFSGLVIPIWLWFCALKKPAEMQVPIELQEELIQIDNGVCLFIPQIDRGDKYGPHQEQIICQKERINNLVYYASHDMVEIIGRPFFHFYKGEEELVLDTAAEFDEDYALRIYCSEENRNVILHILQSGLHRIAEQK